MQPTGMERVKLGRTEVQVTPICFGTSGLGDMPDTYGYSVDEERARQTLRAILTGPANFIDTSRNYGFGRSEERIGAALREMGGKPEGFVLSTKLDRDSETNRFDADVARRSLETSLKALGVDQIDLLHHHLTPNPVPRLAPTAGGSVMAFGPNGGSWLKAAGKS